MNPFVSISPHEDQIPAHRSGILRLVALSTWLYPLALILALYGTWAIAGLILGHMPRPSIDDPTSISPVVDIPYYATGLVIVTFPAFAMLGFCLTSFRILTDRGRRLWRAGQSALFVALWGAVFAFIRWDLLDVVNWYMD